MERAKEKWDQIDEEFESLFGRQYGGQIEEYMTDDAEIVIVFMGSSAGTGKVVVDMKRSEGRKVGLVKIRLFRPFPWQRLAEVFKNKKAIGVLDRNVCQPWGCGHVHLEIKAVLNNMRAHIPLVGFIDGLCGADITKDHIGSLIDTAYSAALGKDHKEVTWVALEEEVE
jgi:pyruvate/2-oxoacid:ferredoxin oxidoreductase alpha subunit